MCDRFRYAHAWCIHTYIDEAKAKGNSSVDLPRQMLPELPRALRCDTCPPVCLGKAKQTWYGMFASFWESSILVPCSRRIATILVLSDSETTLEKKEGKIRVYINSRAAEGREREIYWGRETCIPTARDTPDIVSIRGQGSPGSRCRYDGPRPPRVEGGEAISAVHFGGGTR